jgi:hypothetical protein
VDKDTVLIGQGFGSSRVSRTMGAESGNQFRGILSMLDSQPSTPLPEDSRVVHSMETPCKPSPVIDPKKLRSTVRASNFKPKRQVKKIPTVNRRNSVGRADSKTLDDTSPWGLEQHLREFFKCPKKIEYFEDFNYQEIEALFTKMKLEKERLLSKYNQVGRFLKCAQDFVELKSFAMKMDNVLTPRVINDQNTLIGMYEHLSGLLSKNDKF